MSNWYTRASKPKEPDLLDKMYARRGECRFCGKPNLHFNHQCHCKKWNIDSNEDMSEKTAQQYADIKRNDYEDWDEFKSNQYFSIGQHDMDDPEEGLKPTTCWYIPYSTREDEGYDLEAKAGGTHAMNFGVEAREYWRGWYDPNQQLVSIVVPPDIRATISRRRKGMTLSDVPQFVLTKLRGAFPDKWRAKVF